MSENHGFKVEYVESKGLTALVLPKDKIILIHAALEGSEMEREIIDHEVGHTSVASLQADYVYDLKEYLNPLKQIRLYKILLKKRGVKYFIAWLLASFKWLSPYFLVGGRIIANNSWLVAWSALSVALLLPAFLFNSVWLLQVMAGIFLVSASAYSGGVSKEMDELEEQIKGAFK